MMPAQDIFALWPRPLGRAQDLKPPSFDVDFSTILRRRFCIHLEIGNEGMNIFCESRLHFF